LSLYVSEKNHQPDVENGPIDTRRGIHIQNIGCFSS